MHGPCHFGDSSQTPGVAAALQVLVVEDDENDSLLLQLSVRALNLGWELHRVKDGQEAIEFLGSLTANRLPLGIITDIKMPRKNGLELLQELASKPEFMNIPTAVLSSSRLQTDIIEAMANADAFFTKPGTLREFQMAISEIDILFRRLSADRLSS